MVTSHISIKCLPHSCHLKCTDTFYRTLPPEAILEKTGRGKRRRGGGKKPASDTIKERKGRWRGKRVI